MEVVMKTQRKFYCFFFWFIAYSTIALAQSDSILHCGMPDVGALYGGMEKQESILATHLGGRYMTTRDTLNVLIVFVQFPDDIYDTTYALWPTRPISGIYNGPTYLRTFIDSLPSQMTTNGNLTHYFRQMSLGQFTLIGKTRFVVTPHTRQWYINNNWRRWNINREVLEALDANLNFEEFDRYRRLAVYEIRRESDERVDDIFMIYRNVAHDLPNTSTIMTNMDFHGGESSLGYARTGYPYFEPTEFDVDGGARHITHGHPAVTGAGLGTTSVIAGMIDGWGGLNPYRVQIHEFAHHWMTIGDYYGHNGRGLWAMLNDYGFRHNGIHQSPPNSFEREILGWISPDSIYQTTYNVTLTDYVTTGRAIKIPVPGGATDEYFRLEYHLKTSQFDNPEMHDPNAKGLYIIHQKGMTNPFTQIRLLPADGRWSWVSDEIQYPPYYPNGLAVFKKSGIDRVNGYDDSYRITYTWQGQGQSPRNPDEIYFYRDRATNELVEKTVFLGDGQDAFGFDKNKIFSPWSNPNSQNNSKQSTGVAFEIINENAGVCTLNIYFGESAALSLAPSKPQDVISSLNSQNQAVTNWAANIESDVTTGGGYNIYREIYYGTTVVSDVKLNSSLLTGTSYTDDNIALSAVLPNGVNLYTRYKIEAVDNTGKVSVKALGNPIFLGTTQQVSGTISTTTWTGVKFVTGNVTINSGNTLTVSPNTFVFFTASKSLTISGRIIANNSTFQPIEGVAGYGIIVNGNGYDVSSFTNCTIKGNTYGVIVGGSTFRSPNMYKCDIQGNAVGIWVKYSGNPWVEHCYIKATNSTGTAVRTTNNAEGFFISCKLYGTCRYGHTNSNSSIPMYGYYNSGRNIIDGTEFSYVGGIDAAGVYVTGGYPYFTQGKNYFVYRYYYYRQYNNISANPQLADGNYWGVGGPWVAGQVTTSPVLSQMPNPIGPNWTLQKTSEEDLEESKNELTDAWLAYFERDYKRSGDLSRNVFDTRKKSAQSAEALFLWMKSSLAENKLKAEENILSSLNRSSAVHQSANYEALRWLTKLAVYDGDFKKAEEYALTIPNSSSYGREILLDLAVEILERWSDIDKAALVLDKLVERYPDKETAREKEFVLNLYSEYISQMGSGTDEPGIIVEEDVSALNLLDAYPNPFNPMTTIQFQIPTSQNHIEMEAFVSLRVYDILGNEVATLVNEMKKPGNYKVTFDASELASGMYIYRLQTNSTSGGSVSCKKMILVK
jgi:M6 family metalloprotease-like protein